MPAEVENMMWVGQMPWHGLGVQLPAHALPKDALVAAKMNDWNVSTQPIYRKKADGTFVEIESHREIARTSDDTNLGICGTRYVPIQNEAFVEPFEIIVKEKQAVIETAGSLYDGRIVWMLAKLPKEILIPGAPEEQIKEYLLLSNAHDGSGAWRMFFSNVRVVCANTYNMALSDRKAVRDGISIRHTTSAEAKIKEAHRIIKLASDFNADFEKKVLKMAATKYTDVQMKELASKLFVPVTQPGEKKKEESTRSKNMQEKVIELFAYGKGHEKIRGTAWAALSAVTEFADHHRSTRTEEGGNEKESRLASVWFGSGKTLKQKAWEIMQDQVPALKAA